MPETADCNGIILASHEDAFSELILSLHPNPLKLRLSIKTAFTNVLTLVVFVPYKEFKVLWKVIAAFSDILMCF